MTSQRALHSTARSILFPTQEAGDKAEPDVPSTLPKQRTISGLSSSSGDSNGPITFRELDEEERTRLWDELKQSLGFLL